MRLVIMEAPALRFYFAAAAAGPSRSPASNPFKYDVLSPAPT